MKINANYMIFSLLLRLKENLDLKFIP